MMPGGSAEAYKYIEPIVSKVAAQVTGPWWRRGQPLPGAPAVRGANAALPAARP
jgi:hypothetical protein